MAADRVIEGIPCRSDARILFWQDGSLREAVLATDLELPDVVIPAGSRIETWWMDEPPVTALIHSAWIALDRVIHGLRLVAGTEVDFKPDGRTVAMAVLAAPTLVAGRRVPAGEAVYCHAGRWELEAR